MINPAQVVGVIAGYHPFHDGHLYQMQNMHALIDTSCCVVFLSSYLVQRGMPMIYPPLKRAEAAFRAGADAVLEVPTPFSSSSVHDYVAHGVSLLAGLGIPNLCCGTKDVFAEEFSVPLEIIDENPEAFQYSLCEGLRAGLSYVETRVSATVADLYQTSADSTLLPRTGELLSKLNNILAFKYVRVARIERIPIRLATVSRKGSDCHNLILQGDFSSVAATRTHILNGGSWDDSPHTVPHSVQEVLAETPYLDPDCLVRSFERRVLDLLHEGTTFSTFSDVSDDLADRIANASFREDGFEALMNSLKTRQYAHTRVAHVLTHIFLDIWKSDVLRWKNAMHEETPAKDSSEGTETTVPPIGAAPYACLLGLRRDSKGLLPMLKQAATIPIVSRSAVAGSLLRLPAVCDLSQAKMHATDLWNSLYFWNGGMALPSYFHRQVATV